jgi:hypothetical protein
MTQANHTDIFQQLHEAHQILDEPQFTLADASVVVGATPKAIEHMLEPKKERVRLSGRSANPGKGKRRILTGEDVLKITAAHAMSIIGFPHRWSIHLTDQVGIRASSRVSGIAQGKGMRFATYPIQNGEDCAFTPVFEDQPEPPRLPLAVQLLDVDRLIDETMAKLIAVVKDEPVPDFSVPDIKVEDPYSPETDFFRMWVKDDAGNNLLVGLTLEETVEYLSLQDRSQRHLHGDDLDRSIALHDKHELARHQRMAEEYLAKERETGPRK